MEELRIIKQTIDGTAGLIVVKQLNGETRKQWEVTFNHGELPDLDDSMKILRNYCKVLDSCQVAKVASTKPPKSSSASRTSHPAAISSPRMSVRSVQINTCSFDDCIDERNFKKR